jgi:hypothetical protein
MKTVTPILTMPGRSLCCAAVALFVIGFSSGPAIAVDPPPNVNRPNAPVAVATDPYLAYLASLDDRNAICRERSSALRTLLAERERVAREFFRILPADRAQVIGAMEKLDRQIDDAETSLETSVAATEPTDAPNLAPPPVIDLEAIREQSKRWRRPIYLPMPPPLVIPALPAPPREALYLDYLSVRAGSSKFAQSLVADVTRLLHERRELAYRHAHARAHERARIEDTIRAVSLHVRISSRAAAEAVVVNNW